MIFNKVEFRCGILYHADCFDILAEKDVFPVDAVITSPPYNLNKEHSGGGKTRTAKEFNRKYDKRYDDCMPEDLYQSQQICLIRSLLEKVNGSIFYNHRIRYAWHGRNKYRTPSNVYHPMDWLNKFPIWAEIIWDRMGAGTPNHRVNLRHEYIYQIGKPTGGDLSGESSVWQIPPDRERNGHVCPFPVKLAQRCLKIGTDIGQTVFDPFMGSGTTAIAAISMGRRFIGAEIDKKTFEASVSRVLEFEKQGNLFC